MRLLILVAASLFAIDSLVLAVGYSECDRSECGSLHGVLVGAWFATGAVALVAATLAIVRALTR